MYVYINLINKTTTIMKTISYSTAANIKNQMKDNNFKMIQDVLVNVFNHIYSFNTIQLSNTEFILRWDNPEAPAGKTSLIHVHVNMGYNMINDNYIVNCKLLSTFNDSEWQEFPYHPLEAPDTMCIGFEKDECASGIDINNLVCKVTDFFIEYFSEQRRNINTK